MLSIIVAVAKNNVIGKDNNLIWHLPEDLKRFKSITTGKKIIMGRKTFDSLGRILPNRYHIVISNNKELNMDNDNVKVIKDISLLDEYIKSKEECFVIGGETIYRLLMPVCDKMYITYINQKFDGDVFFPEINLNEWKIIGEEQGVKNDKNPFDYKYVTYLRNK